MPPTGNKIEAMSGEVFEFNPQGLMKKLTTITELDRVESEIKGDIKIDAFQKISLQPIVNVDLKTRAVIHAAARSFTRTSTLERMRITLLWQLRMSVLMPTARCCKESARF